jgi:hypothetical protein
MTDIVIWGHIQWHGRNMGLNIADCLSNSKGPHTMNRKQLIEHMAISAQHAHREAPLGTMGLDLQRFEVIAIFAAIEAAGFAIVPREATEAGEHAGWKVEAPQAPSRMRDAMLKEMAL